MQSYEPKFLSSVILYNGDVDVQYCKSTSDEGEQAILVQRVLKYQGSIKSY